MDNEIEVNGKPYVLKSSIKKVAGGPATKKQIVVLQRGWVAVGDYSVKGEEARLDNASVIRYWGTKKGLGELALSGPTSTTILDVAGTIRFNVGAEVLRMDLANPEKWA